MSHKHCLFAYGRFVGPALHVNRRFGLQYMYTRPFSFFGGKILRVEYADLYKSSSYPCASCMFVVGSGDHDYVYLYEVIDTGLPGADALKVVSDNETYPFTCYSDLSMLAERMLRGKYCNQFFVDIVSLGLEEWGNDV